MVFRFFSVSTSKHHCGPTLSFFPKIFFEWPGRKTGRNRCWGLELELELGLELGLGLGIGLGEGLGIGLGVEVGLEAGQDEKNMEGKFFQEKIF